MCKGLTNNFKVIMGEPTGKFTEKDFKGNIALYGSLARTQSVSCGFAFLSKLAQPLLAALTDGIFNSLITVISLTLFCINSFPITQFSIPKITVYA